MTGLPPPCRRDGLRAWLEYVAALAIDMLDDLDAADADMEDDELGDDASMGGAR